MKELALDYWAIQPGDLVKTDLRAPLPSAWWLVNRTGYERGHQVWLSTPYAKGWAERILSEMAHEAIRESTRFEVIRPEGEPLEWLLAFLAG